MRKANSVAEAEKLDVVTNTPLVAPSPTRLPVKAWTSGRPTAVPASIRSALNVDAVKTENVLVDHAVDTAVT